MVEQIVWLVGVLALMLIPTALLMFRKFESRWNAGALCFFLVGGTLASWYMAPWFAWSYYLRNIVVAIVALGALVGLYRIAKASWSRPSIMPLITSVFLALAGSYFMFQNVQAWRMMSTSVEPIELASPIKDTPYAIVQGGAGPPLQGGHAGPVSQQFAVDFVALNSWLTADDNYLQYGDFRATKTWGLPVYAPCDGEVVWAHDGVEDSAEHDMERPAGNVVGISCKGATVMLAHLRKGTVAVEEGDSVTTGELLGELGMSGRTFGTHLHMHAERGPLMRDFSENEAVPMLIDGEFLMQGQMVGAAD